MSEVFNSYQNIQFWCFQYIKIFYKNLMLFSFSLSKTVSEVSYNSIYCSVFHFLRIQMQSIKLYMENIKKCGYVTIENVQKLFLLCSYHRRYIVLTVSEILKTLNYDLNIMIKVKVIVSNNLSFRYYVEDFFNNTRGSNDMHSEVCSINVCSILKKLV